MNWNRDKKSVNGGISCMLRKLWMEKSIACWALGGKFKQWIGIETRTLGKRRLLESWQELFSRESCASRNTIACWAWGGKFKQWIGESCEWRNQLHVELWGGKFQQWIGIETRTLGKRRLWMEKSIACWAWGGNLNNELESRQELFSRERCESRNTIACWALGGGNLNNELESKQELLGKEGCEWRNLLLVELLGGKFKQWIGIGGRTLRKRKLWIEKYYCMLSFGGEI